jgi:hypothetical protein
MEKFQRFVTSNVEILHVSSVVAVTVVSGIIGAVLGTVVAAATKGGIGWPIAMFLIVGAAGLIVSAAAVSIALTLREIAGNTRESTELLRRLSIAYSRKSSGVRDGTASSAAPDGHEIFIDASKELTAQSLSVLRRARQNGYEITVASDKKSITARKSNDQHQLVSNSQILQFGSSKGWLPE